MSEGAAIASELWTIATFRGGFNATLVIAGTSLLGLAAGVIGVFALLRKRSLVADALAHATLPGVALAFLVSAALGGDGRSLPALLAGAAATGALGVACVQALLRYTRLHEDAAIGIVLSVFFGAGVVGLSYIQANASAGSAGLTGLIFGQAATMRPSDVALMGVVATVGVLGALLLLKEFTLVCFNDDFARVQGWPVSLIDGLMMALVVLATVAGLQAVGLILVVALLIVPPVAARFWTERVWVLVALAGLIGALSGYLGAVASAALPRKPAGAVIVLAAGAIFAISLLAAPRRGVIASAWRRARLRLRIAGEHLLEAAHDRGVDVIEPGEIAAVARERGWPRAARIFVAWSLVRRGDARRERRGALRLTPRGIDRGRRVARNHALWEQYLVSYADVAPSHVDWSVDQVEHVLSEELVAELESRLASLGRPAPAAPGGAR